MDEDDALLQQRHDAQEAQELERLRAAAVNIEMAPGRRPGDCEGYLDEPRHQRDECKPTVPSLEEKEKALPAPEHELAPIPVCDAPTSSGVDDEVAEINTPGGEVDDGRPTVHVGNARD